MLYCSLNGYFPVYFGQLHFTGLKVLRHHAGVVHNSDPCQIITPLVLVGLGLDVGEGLGLGNQIAISTRGVMIWQGVENAALTVG